MVSSPIVYSYDMPYLMCDNVAAFVDASMRYYVRVRAMFETGNVLNAFGSVSIWIMGDPANILFVPLNRVVGLTTVPYSDFKDITGFHSADGGNIETMVIGQPDNNQGNATSFALNNYLNNGNSFVGIDP